MRCGQIIAPFCAVSADADASHRDADFKPYVPTRPRTLRDSFRGFPAEPRRRLEQPVSLVIPRKTDTRS